MDSTDSVAKLAAALAQFQGAVPAIPTNQEARIRTRKTDANGNPIEYTFAYADLAQTLAVVREPLAAAGLSVTQTLAPDAGDGWLLLVTTLLHASGESLASVVRLRGPGEDRHAFGGDLTYLRRCTLTAILGVASGQAEPASPDDAPAPMGARHPAKAARERRAKAATPKSTTAEKDRPRAAAELWQQAQEAGIAAESLTAWAQHFFRFEVGADLAQLNVGQLKRAGLAVTGGEVADWLIERSGAPGTPDPPGSEV